MPDAFPPVAIYFLKRGGGTVFAPGRHPVGYSRRVHSRKSLGLGGSNSMVDADLLRLEWLAGLLGIGVEHLPLAAIEQRTVPWTDGPGLRADVLDIEPELRDGYGDLGQGLVAGRLLTRAKRCRRSPLRTADAESSPP